MGDDDDDEEEDCNCDDDGDDRGGGRLKDDEDDDIPFLAKVVRCHCALCFCTVCVKEVRRPKAA
jgi:hypothetical protein